MNSFGSKRTLSKRTQEIVEALASDISQKEAAAKLGIHIRTLEDYLKRARARLGVRTTIAVVVYHVVKVHGMTERAGRRTVTPR